MSVVTLPWLYVEDLDPATGQAWLQGEEWHHAHHVLRMRAGDAMILFDGRGICFEGRLRNAGKSAGEVELIGDRSTIFQNPRNYSLTIAFAPTKNMDRTEFAIEKLVELGADRIVLLKCQHSERTRIRLDRLQKVILSAAKQSHKLVLPELTSFIEPRTLIQKFEILIQQKVKSPSGDLGVKSAFRNPQSAILCCHLDESSKPFHHTYQPADDVMILIGPEGGFSDSEVEELKAGGAEMTTLGPFRLRVETAAITACAQVHLLHEMKTRK